MILTLNSDFLRSALSLCSRIKSKGTLPILDYVRITLPPGKIEATVEFTDLDIHILTVIPLAGPASPGSFTIALRTLAKLLSATDRGSAMRFEAVSGKHDYNVEITYLSKKLQTTSTFIGVDPETFISLIPAEGARFILPSDTIKAIHHLKPATSTDETRYVLNGVYITPDGGGKIIATDGRRLAITTARIPCVATILPTKLVGLLNHPLLDSAAVAILEPDAALISLAFGKTTVHSKTIDGNFPNYQQVIPPKPNFSATIPDAAATAILPWLNQQAARIANTKNNSIRLTLRNNTITLDANDPGRSAVTTAIPAYMPDAPDGFSISFNPAFLADGLALGLRTIDFIDEMSPGLLTNGTTRYVLMPMRGADSPTKETEPETEDPEESQPADPEAIEVEATEVPA